MSFKKNCLILAKLKKKKVLPQNPGSEQQVLEAEGSVSYSSDGIPSVDGAPLVDCCWPHA